MKPKWEDAPEWANYLAVDFDGIWWWFENEPYNEDDSINGDGGIWIPRGGMVEQAELSIDWEDSLEKRPLS